MIGRLGPAAVAGVLKNEHFWGSDRAMNVPLLLACFLTAIVFGCTAGPTADRAQLAGIAREARTTIDFIIAHPGTDVSRLPIPTGMKSAGVTRLHKSAPGALYDGLYMGVSNPIAQDAGYFVPSEPESFVGKDTIGVSFRPLGEGVFWYEVER
jgi:hypothetical protein